MPRFKLTLEYSGTRFRGWQAQADSKGTTIQGELHRVLSQIAGTELELPYGSGRTDAGVHALGQVAHVDLPETVAAEGLAEALNARLPADLHVLSAVPADPRFHARHHAEARSYLYQVSRRRTALAKPFVWWVKEPLETARMSAAARAFVGRHDFRNFTPRVKKKGASTLVEVEAVEIAEAGDLVLIRIVGSHFLWQMVRRLVGVLVEAGRGKLDADAVAALLVDESDLPGRLAASPSGLFLERVFYPGDRRDFPLVPAFPVG